jgi:hypothetical protein
VAKEIRHLPLTHKILSEVLHDAWVG